MRPPETLWSWTARSMALGAAYDAAFAAAILLFPEPASALLRIPLPADLLYFRFIGVFLLMLAAMYLLAAREPRRYQGVILVAAAGRLAGFLYLARAWSAGAPSAFLGLACADLLLAGLHAALLRGARRADGAR
ncbi:MAG TPA: hypothetical protein VFV75_09235 [Candidatus Polarisedimenticolaceae bacterium]|nr:hypothetical protein [Candidatus Polarisedimenticolaceae bacterium]